jgi:hypothetical protein
MRLWHLIYVILLVALVMTISRDPAGRVALVVFVTGLGEVILGTTSLLVLFQSVGMIGEAKGLGEHVEALATTAVVLAVATALMSGWLALGIWLVLASVA